MVFEIVDETCQEIEREMIILASTRRQHRYDKGMDKLDIDRLAESRGYIRRLGRKTRQNARSRRRVGT